MLFIQPCALGGLTAFVEISIAKQCKDFLHGRKKSPWTELNKERCKWLEKHGKMTDAGRLALANCKEKFEISARIQEIINSDDILRRHFYSFPEIYQRLRIDSIQRHFPYKNRNEMCEKQIKNFIKQTRLGKMYGNLSDYGRLFNC